jgi:hypothetical protein
MEGIMDGGVVLEEEWEQMVGDGGHRLSIFGGVNFLPQWGVGKIDAWERPTVCLCALTIRIPTPFNHVVILPRNFPPRNIESRKR